YSDCIRQSIVQPQFLCTSPAAYLLLPSFPTRRSSDLLPPLCSRPRQPCPPDRALIVSRIAANGAVGPVCVLPPPQGKTARRGRKDRKSTRLNSSHVKISYAVFCLNKNKNPHKIGAAEQ